MSDPTKHSGYGAGTVKRTNPSSDPFEARLRERKRSGRTWNDATPEHLHAAIAAVTATGDALLFGTTSDGGALTAIIMRNGKKYPWYVQPNDDIGAVLGDLMSLYT